ncbi:phage major capsid protein [Tardibacter chloracetimidivorans]|nr:phage major capsid protein [Tardibacter chloracetimidivorans]
MMQRILTTASAAALIARRDAELPEQMLRRDLMIEVRAESINEESRTVELSFSSEEPYERWWGVEILDHGRKAVRLGRLNGGAALLVNHDPDDQVGVVEKAWLDGKKGRALVRFGRSPRAEEVYQDVKDGIRKLVSVGYRIAGIKLESSENNQETYRVTDWEPYEVSLVAVPADATVGVGRDGEAPAFDPRTLVSPEEEDDMNFQRRDGASPSAAPAGTTAAAPVAPAPVPAAPTVDVAAATRAATDAERARVQTITAMGGRLNCGELARDAIADGRSLEQFIADYEQRAGNQIQIRVAEDPAIGLTERETRQFSFVRLMNALANPNDRRANEAAAFEIECSQAAQVRTGQTEARGFRVPVDVLRAPLIPQQRDLSVGTATAGGHTVATDLLAGSFIDMLRNALALTGLGVRMLTDLNGNIAIPRQTGGATAYWVGEAVALTESQQAFDQVAMSPKTLGAFTDYGRQLLMQSSIDIESFVRSDIAKVIALAIDLAGVNGSGTSNQPRGIMQTAGIGSVAGGTNGAAPTWDHMVDLETAVSVANADLGSLGYLTNSKVRGKLKKTQKFSSTNGDPVWERGNEVNGYRAAVSNQVPATLTKGTADGVCSAIIYGNWADMLIGLWGGLDLMVNPYILSPTGSVRVEAFQSLDVNVRHPESFSAMLDALTA